MNTQHITKGQLDTLKKLGLPEVKENNQWLLFHVKGDGEKAPQSWNAKIYTNSAGNMKVVTTDMAIFAALLGGQQQDQLIVPHGKSEARRVISIDDSGWGFPLLGTLVGLHDSLDDSIHIGEVPVKFYQPPLFERKDYLFQAASVVTKLIGELKLENADCFRP